VFDTPLLVQGEGKLAQRAKVRSFIPTSLSYSTREFRTKHGFGLLCLIPLYLSKERAKLAQRARVRSFVPTSLSYSSRESGCFPSEARLDRRFRFVILSAANNRQRYIENGIAAAGSVRSFAALSTTNVTRRHSSILVLLSGTPSFSGKGLGVSRMRKNDEFSARQYIVD